ncbi:hypothetical protein [Thalassotalea agarivorans]|uniref:Outer membrane protein beta-barrel domain-containing protein n=1 Tax=Thalassotalea agarivorans TaxID=349064 RepID=A0A1I0AIL9_THASX|nr:hypothetical protein [Thalassotalea agarivorans]SES94146.1 hypothetical protein SAMN05660429_00721 [Thalassotalea agarivorans]
MKVVLIFCAFSLVSTQLTAKADERITFGVGLGHSYSGLGANLGYQTEESFTYLSAGCVGYSTLKGSTCGAGIGWVTTALSQGDNHHGIGAYAGVVGVEQGVFDNEAVYGAAITYHYFFNTIAEPGFNLGFSVAGGTVESEFELVPLISFGYQF